MHDLSSSDSVPQNVNFTLPLLQPFSPSQSSRLLFVVFLTELVRSSVVHKGL